uniref:Transposon protein, putative, CACTA, En/Spm sub-class n=2 Tax=Oryza sativa subsp. japonica TaxID=39947 RepID=A0A5S6R7W6_ORYSJ|nr:transposon protein, putative, CACTA, En/Spm sub-class [Oryza sativa Japonica Group]ABA93243.2 transposon protein, putative, CACTA, En/Spm sub-class [Oryza sativa Japonica Group]
MDRQWMYADWRSKEFIDGMHYFLRVAETNRQRGFICCPCNKCKNQKEYSASRTIHFHLFESRLMPSYNCWTSHGEQGVEMEEDEVEDDNIPDFAQYVGFEGNQTGEEEIAADGNDVADDLGQMLQDAREDCESEKEAHKLDKMLEDHRTSLYPGCEQGHKKLDTTLEFLQWKAKNGVSDKAFGDLLKLVKNILPGGNKLPETMYEAKKIVCPLGLEVHKIHACPNDCILYRGEEYENLEACPVCKALRYKIRRDDPGEVDGQLTKKRIPAKLWKKEGVPVWDEDKQEEFNLQALLFVTINDWPALSNLSGQSNKGYKACTHCMDETESTYLKHCRKVVYMGHRRFLAANHPMADRDEEQILYDTIAEGSSQYWNEEEGNKDPNQYLNEEGNDNVPVSTVYWRRTRARGDHESFVPDSEKEMLWTTMLETFTLPAGTEDKVKRWTLKKMVEQFQSFKGDLYQKYILKRQTPNIDTFPKLRDHSDEFVAYKTGEQGQAMMERNKENAAKKKYHHHLGSGGYSVAMPKWEEMEASLIERGIELATANWPERSKFWYYAHGGTLNPADGSLVFSDQIREAARRLTDAVEASSQGTFRPDRDRDELTLALQTPEHPGRTRGKWVIPWKIGFKEDIHTYRSRMRSKRDTEAKIADLEFRVSSYELNMQEEVARKVDERMAAHRSHDLQPTIPPSMVSPSGNRSSCASTGQVASGMAIPTDPSGSYHYRPIPAGYSKVEVELVEGAYEDLKLDYPRGDGSCTVSSSCSASTVSTSGSSTDSSSGSCTDSSSGSYTYSSASSSSGTFKVKGPPPAPPPAHTRATKKAKVDAAKNKDPGYDCTQEELDAYVASEVKRQFKPRSPEKKIPIDPSVRNFFRGVEPIEKAKLKYMYELGKPLVKPELVQSLPTQMYKFHQLYMEMSTTSREMIGARITDPDFLQGDDILWINFKGIYEVYQLDALDVSIMSCWILMEIQRARRRRVFDTGFIDPRRVNVAMLDQYPQETEDNLVHLLKAQHYKTFILLPYNTEFHWVLLLFDLSACTVNVYDSMDKKESTFDKVFELIDRAWYRFRHLVRGNWRERLRRRFKFPCAKQKQGTNLCGYYVCEYCHCLADQIITTRELDFIRMRDNLTTHKEFIAAVQEQLMGFINEEILDPKGEFYYDGNTIHQSLASELAATTTTSKS